MTDTLTELDPEALRRQLVHLFEQPKLSGVIVAAGLGMVAREVADLRAAIEGAENGADQVVETVAKLADEVRRGQRKHLGAVAQAKKEHARAEQLAAEVEQLRTRVADWRRATGAGISRLDEARAENDRLRAELADYQLAASEAEGAQQRPCGATIDGLTCGRLGPCVRPSLPQHDLHETADGTKWGNIRLTPPAPEQPVPATFQREPRVGDHVRVSIDGELHHDPRGFGTYTLVHRPGPNGTAVGYFNIPPSATVTFLAAAEQAPAEDDCHEVEIAGQTVRVRGAGQLGTAAAEAVAALLRGAHQGLASDAAAAPCWCGHDPGVHVTDDGDNAVCRACWTADNFHQAHHVHTPEASQ